MQPTLLIAAHHLKRIARKPGLIVLLIAVPFTLAVIQYFAFGRTVAAGKLPPIPVLLIDEDESFLTQNILPGMLTAGPLQELIQIQAIDDRETARSMFQKNEAAALVVFTEGMEAAILDGGGAEIQVIPNPVQTFSPQIVESVLEMLVLIGNSLYDDLAGPAEIIMSFFEQQRGPTFEEFQKISALMETAGPELGKLATIQDLEVLLQRPEGEASSGFGTSPGEFFAYVFPGLVIFALFFISQILAVRLLRDRMEGLQTRLLTTPASRVSILFGGMIYMVTGLFVLLVLLGVLAAWVFGIELRAPLTLMMFGLGLSVFIAGLQLTITGLAKSDRGAGFAAGVIIMLLALLGGSFMPADNYPSFLQAIAFRLPNGAAQQGIVELLVHRYSFAQVAPRLATTWIWGLLLLGTAFRYEGRRMVKR
jgi:ABC-2 type transport system permease protein